jgi:hypothetical protein
MLLKDEKNCRQNINLNTIEALISSVIAKRERERESEEKLHGKL